MKLGNSCFHLSHLLALRKAKEAKKIFFSIVKVSFLGGILVLPGCNMGPGQMFGQVGGGAVGALLGSMVGKGRGQLVATAIGAIVGSSFGGAIGKNFDERDKQLAGQAADDSLVSGQQTRWHNPSTGHHGTVTSRPIRSRHASRPCREVKMLVYSDDGQPMEAIHYVEQGSDGRWYMVR